MIASTFEGPSSPPKSPLRSSSLVAGDEEEPIAIRTKARAMLTQQTSSTLTSCCGSADGTTSRHRGPLHRRVTDPGAMAVADSYPPPRRRRGEDAATRSSRKEKRRSLRNLFRGGALRLSDVLKLCKGNKNRPVVPSEEEEARSREESAQPCEFSDVGSEEAVAVTASVDMAATAPEVFREKNEAAAIYQRHLQDYLDEYIEEFEGGDLKHYHSEDGFDIFADPDEIQEPPKAVNDVKIDGFPIEEIIVALDDDCVSIASQVTLPEFRPKLAD